jgi:hypothetical protein
VLGKPLDHPAEIVPLDAEEWNMLVDFIVCNLLRHYFTCPFAGRHKQGNGQVRITVFVPFDR